MNESWRLGSLDPWKEDVGEVSDTVKEMVYQYGENETATSLPHVVAQLPMRPTVMGTDSPHQTGDHTPYDILTRAPLYSMTSHFTRVDPHAPKRGVHRHLGAPTLFCTSGKGWELNDDEEYLFEQYDMLVVPPYTVHQHGGDEDLGCVIYVPETGRIGYTLGSLGGREQHKLGEKPSFPDGTEPLYGDNGELKGYRIKKGVLGIPEDIEVVLGPDPEMDAVFVARRSAKSYEGEPETTYDRYLKMLYDEAEYCRKVAHVVRFADEPWELTRQGKLKWVVHPSTECAAKDKWIYFQELPPESRSGLHRHAAEELILVLEGRGYDVHEDERWNWEMGDLIAIPAMMKHQHFSLGERVLTLHSMPRTYTNLGLGGIEQIADCPEWVMEHA